MMPSASSLVEGSGTVGPEAMIEGSSPGTSEIISATTLAGAAAAASLPPLMAERCFRTVFISEMVAPLLSSALFTACLSSSVSPSGGSASSAEPPPEIRQSTRSSSVSPCTSSRMRRAASRPAASGTGCAASTTSSRLGRHAIAVARHHQAFDRPLPGIFQRLGHRAATPCRRRSRWCGPWAAWADAPARRARAARPRPRPGTWP